MISSLKKRAESLGYKVYIVPGGSFVKRIVKKDAPSGALGVACGYELNYSMMEISQFCPVQGVPLLKNGCYCTKVDEELVEEKVLLGVQETEREKREEGEKREGKHKRRNKPNKEIKERTTKNKEGGNNDNG